MRSLKEVIQVNTTGEFRAPTAIKRSELSITTPA